MEVSLASTCIMPLSFNSNKKTILKHNNNNFFHSQIPTFKVSTKPLFIVNSSIKPTLSSNWLVSNDLSAKTASPWLPKFEELDTTNMLLRQRIVFLGSQVDDMTADFIISQLLFLDADDPKKDIKLFISSPGGSVTAGMGIYDAMKLCKADISTVCFGLAASMGAFLLASGTKGKRYCMPNSKVMIHQPLGGASGRVESGNSLLHLSCFPNVNCSLTQTDSITGGGCARCCTAMTFKFNSTKKLNSFCHGQATAPLGIDRNILPGVVLSYFYEFIISEFSIRAREMVYQKVKVNKILSRITGKSEEQIDLDTDRDNFMNPWEAKEYGLVDDVIDDGKPGLVAPNADPTPPPKLMRNIWEIPDNLLKGKRKLPSEETLTDV
ncbi:hypothetical protein TSUD_323410 [Trifolium subterraneum]|uniref:ATP-dependent Clp protease proteolytic subunit n=1 Tax=Trifolium subterraneum TaxID=3900 RepID=A0A2Z6N7I3_TRISU|nr:hypothetical protein TSUD_323410 [Trifolium subterraneum]